MIQESRPLIAHVIHHLVTGGLENGLVNLLNRLPAERYRHAVVCMKDYSDFRKRIVAVDIPVFAMHKRAGKDLGTQWRLLRLFRRLRPAIVHSRGLSGLDSLIPASLAGVGIRIHGEHGRDEQDLDGTNRKLIWLRRLHNPFVTRYVVLNRELEDYLVNRVGVGRDRTTLIRNGVDVARFRPEPGNARASFPDGFRDPDLFVVGTVGRLQPVKDPCTLVRAFARAVARDHVAARRLRLVIVGDGPMRGEIERLLGESGVATLTWLVGDSTDVPRLLQGFDLFVLPSRWEGISNTILEAMACRLPVLATAVGGNLEVVEDGVTGRLVAPAAEEALAEGILGYARDPGAARRHGEAGRVRVEKEFGLERMVASYDALYATLLRRRPPRFRAGLAERQARPASGPPAGDADVVPFALPA